MSVIDYLNGAIGRVMEVWSSTIYPFLLSIWNLLNEFISWCYNNPDKAGLIALIPLFYAFFAQIKALFAAVFSPFWNFRQNKLISKNVPHSNHPTFSDFIDAYHESFSEEERVSTAEMIRWSDGEYYSHDIEYRNDVVYKNNDVVGICNYIVSKSNKFAYVGHFGVVKSIGSFKDQSKIYTLCFKKLQKSAGNWKYIVFEIDDPEEETGFEKTERAARIRRFESQSRMLGYEMRFADIKYWYPTFENDCDVKNWGISKLGIICRNKKQTEITKEELGKILQFLYKDVYGHCLGKDISRRENFSKEIMEITKEYMDNSEEKVKLI